MKFYAFTLVALFFSLEVSAQQGLHYSLFSLNKYNFNSAYAGLDNSISITGVYRKQWVNIPGAPESQNVNFHLPLYLLKGAFGVNVENKAIGPEQNVRATISYNYFLNVGRKGLLSIGLAGGIHNKSLDGTKLRTPEGNYQPESNVIEHNDLDLPQAVVAGMAPIINAAIYYQSDILELGFSINNLTESQITLADNGFSANISSNRNYFLIFASNFEIGNSFTLHPTFLAKSDFIENQMEISALLKYNNNIFGGAAFRGYNANTIDAVVLIGGFKLSEKITISYGYDLTLSPLNSVSQGSHEILLNYNLNKKIGAGIPPPIIYNPRSL